MLDQINWGFWQVAVAVAVALATAAWALWERGRRRKDLQYDVVSKAPLVSVSEEARGRIKVLFDEEPVSSVSLAIIQITNRGSPIPSVEFESPLTVSMGADSRIMSVEVMERQPDNLGVELSVDNGRIQIEPLLLNSGDSFTFKVIGTGFADNIEVEGRIVGIKEVRSRGPELSRARLARIGLMSALAGMTVAVIAGVVTGRETLFTASSAIFLALALIAGVSAILDVVAAVGSLRS